MENELYLQVKDWMHRNAREVELCLWKYFFENGSKESVVNALMFYQNEDGGFGHALEADNWNPESTPITTDHALKILKNIGFDDMSHPIYQGIWNYLNSEKDMLSYGWSFTVPGNDNYPHAPWWNYSEEQNQKEYIGTTADFSAFVLKYGSRETAIYQKALKFTDTLMNLLQDNCSYGDMGLEGLVVLADTVKELGFTQYDHKRIFHILNEKITKAIEHDTEKWARYGVRPSNYVNSPQSPFYAANADIVTQELDYLIQTKPEHDVWGITWTWFDNMEKYETYFRISENWWKGVKAIEKVQMLRNFGRL